MTRASYVNIAKAPRKRSAAKGKLVGVRMQDDEIKAIDSWARKQDPPVTRPYAIRRLVEKGLQRSKPVGRPSSKSAERAKQLAAKAIEGLIDPTAPAEEKAIRKRRLVEGPSPFREVRVDREKKN